MDVMMRYKIMLLIYCLMAILQIFTEIVGAQDTKGTTVLKALLEKRVFQTEVGFNTLLITTTPPPARGDCQNEGKWYFAGDIVMSGWTLDGCMFGERCLKSGHMRTEYGSNCQTTTKLPPRHITTTPPPERGDCQNEGKWYFAGDIVMSGWTLDGCMFGERCLKGGHMRTEYGSNCQTTTKLPPRHITTTTPPERGDCQNEGKWYFAGDIVMSGWTLDGCMFGERCLKGGHMRTEYGSNCQTTTKLPPRHIMTTPPPARGDCQNEGKCYFAGDIVMSGMTSDGCMFGLRCIKGGHMRKEYGSNCQTLIHVG